MPDLYASSVLHVIFLYLAFDYLCLFILLLLLFFSTQFDDMWRELCTWLDESMQMLSKFMSPANQPAGMKQDIDELKVKKTYCHWLSLLVFFQFLKKKFFAQLLFIFQIVYNFFAIFL